jgi:hypothetical protein
MKYDEETYKPSFESLSEFLFFSSDSVKRLIKETKKRTDDCDENGRIDVLDQKALYLLWAIPEHLQRFEEEKGAVPEEVQKNIQDLAKIALKALNDQNYILIDRLLREKRDKTNPGNILEKMASKYIEDDKLAVWESLANDMDLE